MDSSDSRKRPLDGESESGVTKRSNQGSVENVHLKVLIPSIAAGAIIGKGGETITQIQKETGANIKMSKANDFYPGTTERVCLVSGSKESVKQVHNFIMDKIREKPDPNPKPIDGETKINFERHKQVKILVPNSTAGMIIGKGGNFIKQIKEESGAYVQISQKSKELSLPERCVTVAGDADQNRAAVDMLLTKIMEDPQSASCPNISYADFKGPVASSNPTGSPFAGPAGQGEARGGGGGMQGNPGMQPGGVFGNIGNSLNNLNLNSQNVGGGGGVGGGVNPALENLKGTLRGSGYSEQAVEEISAAMFTLANYGFLGLGLGLGGLGLGNMGGGMGQQQQQQQQQGNLTLANLAGILNGNVPQNQGNSLLGGGGMNNNMMQQVPNGGGGGGDKKAGVFGPVGSTTTTMAGGDTGEGAGSYFATAGGAAAMGAGDQFTGSGDSMFGNSFNGNNGFPANNGFNGQNQNSFGLGTSMGGFAGGKDEGEKKEVEVGEHIVGAILGPGGRGIVELQKLTGANIQISKKGVYSPGTRNRIVTLAGSGSAIQRAHYMIQQRITQEESKRARQGHSR